MFVQDTKQIGSVGNLISAALETAGHFMQSSFIDVLAHGLGGTLGAFLFIASAVTAFTIIAIGGDYKFGRWFVIGPPLFFALVFARVDSCGPAYVFGERKHDQAEVFDATKEIVDQQTCDATPAKISLFFSIWNDLTSSLVNQFTKILRLNFQDKVGGRDLDFTTKVDRFMGLSNVEIADPMLKEFVNRILLDKCHYYYMQVLQLNDETLQQSKRQIIEQNLETYGNGADVNLSEPAYLNLKNWLVDDDGTAGTADFGVLDTEGHPLFQAPAALFPADQSGFIFNCKQIWAMGVETMKTEAVAVIAEGVPAGSGVSGTDAQKLQDERIELYKKAGYKAGTEVDPVREEVTPASADDKKLVTLINEVAVRSLLREMSNFSKTLRQDHVDQLPINTPAGVRGTAEEQGRFLRDILHRDEYRGKGNFLRMMLGMPYVQGLLLYFLAIAYPFAAMAIIVPGRHTTFLQWLGLWLWVKSWDFGVGVVMVIDDLLYKLMPHGAPLDGKNIDIYNVKEALKAVLQVDPMYSTHVYYNIIATCLAAVPILTGLLVKKGGGEIVNFASQGLESFAGHVEKAMTGFQGSMRAQSLLADTRASIDNAVANAMPEMLARPEVMGNLAKGIAFGVLAESKSIESAAAKLQQSLGSQCLESAVRQAQINYPKGGYEGVTTWGEYLKHIAGDSIRGVSDPANGINPGSVKKLLGRTPDELMKSLTNDGKEFLAMPQIKQLLTLESKRYQKLGVSYFEYGLRLVAYNESMSEANRRRTGLEAALGFFLHPNNSPLPVGGDKSTIVTSDKINWNTIPTGVINQAGNRLVVDQGAAAAAGTYQPQ